MNNPRQNPGRFNIVFYFALAIQTFIVIGIELQIPKDIQNGLFFGFSIYRTIIILFLLLVSVLFLLMGLINKVEAYFSHNIIADKRFLWVIITYLIFLASMGVIFSPENSINESQVLFLQRFLPIFYWSLAVLIQLCGYYFYKKNGLHLNFSQSENQRILIAVAFAAICIASWLMINRSGYGIHPDSVGWSSPTAPLLATHLWVSFTMAIIYELIAKSIVIKGHKLTIIHVLIPVFIYIITYFSWIKQPIHESYFAPEVRPPNYEVYPYSDAAHYSLAAESILLGNGLDNWQIVPRPMMITALSYILLITNGKYTAVILVQTLLLALIPVFMYFLGSLMATKSIGLGLAVISIYREIDTINFNRYITVTDSKLIMSELPTQLLLILLCILLFIAFRQTKIKFKGLFITGGLMGVILLVRSQAVVLIPIIAVLLIIMLRRFHNWIVPVAGLLLGLFLVISPWLIRNYVLTGKISFNAPAQTKMVADRYQMVVDQNGNGEVSEPEAGSPIISSLIRHPLEVIRIVGAHFINNEISSLLSITPQKFITSLDDIYSSTGFWKQSALHFDFQQNVIMCGTIFILAIGMIYSLIKFGIAGWLPLAIQLGYHLSNALARNSGGRFVVPVDWINHLYYFIGLYAFILFIVSIFSPGNSLFKSEGAAKQTKILFNNISLVQVVICLVLIGIFIPATELAFHISSLNLNDGHKSEMQRILDSSVISSTQREEILTTLNQPGMELLSGYVFYPRIYGAGKGEPGSYWTAYSPMPYCRMGFIVLNGNGLTQAYMYINTPPLDFPSRSPIIIIGTNQQVSLRGEKIDTVQVKYVVLPGHEPILLEAIQKPIHNCKLE